MSIIKLIAAIVVASGVYVGMRSTGATYGTASAAMDPELARILNTILSGLATYFGPLLLSWFKSWLPVKILMTCHHINRNNVINWTLRIMMGLLFVASVIMENSLASLGWISAYTMYDLFKLEQKYHDELRREVYPHLVRELEAK